MSFLKLFQDLTQSFNFKYIHIKSLRHNVVRTWISLISAFQALFFIFTTEISSAPSGKRAAQEERQHNEPFLILEEGWGSV